LPNDFHSGQSAGQGGKVKRFSKVLAENLAQAFLSIMDIT
jgi:hypothetical protein